MLLYEITKPLWHNNAMGRSEGIMKKRTLFCQSLLLGVALLCLGCQSAKQAPEVVAPVAHAPVYNENTRVNNPGSLFAESDIDPLFSDSRARRVGDIVVVNIMESTKASNTADTTADKASNNNYNIASAFGRTSLNMFPYLPGGGVDSLEAPVGTGTSVLNTTSSSDFEGSGETTRENTVTASLAARVIRVLPGGILQLEGVRQTRVNEETQYMVITGTIRARDVSAENTIMSTQMADANIQYYGKGVLADKQKPGWFTRFMDNLWPF